MLTFLAGTNANECENTTDDVLEIKCFGIKVPGWKPRHNDKLIAGGVALGCLVIGGTVFLRSKQLEATKLAMESLTQIPFDVVPFKSHFGSLEIFVLAKDNRSKHAYIDYLFSKDLRNKIKSLFKTKGEEEIEFQLIQFGTMIVTNVEFEKLKKYMRARLQKIDWKIKNDCKGSLKVSVECFCYL